ncbi:MAG: hypothetical protein ACI8WT_004228 [Clostridium sp.]|jgi:hypothetical protein
MLDGIFLFRPFIASHCGERICLALKHGYKLPGGRLTGNLRLAEVDMLDGIFLFRPFIASHCGERICLALKHGYKLTGGRLTGDLYEYKWNC